MATASEGSPVNKGVKLAQKSFATGGGNHARFMLGFEDVQGGTAEEFVLRVEGTYWRCYLSDDGSVKLISLKASSAPKTYQSLNFPSCKNGSNSCWESWGSDLFCFPTDREPRAKMEKG